MEFGKYSRLNYTKPNTINKTMKQEFEMTQEEMDHIVAINKGGGDPVMFLSGGVAMGSSLQEKINQYWAILGNKYGFKPLNVEPSSKGKLFFIAEPMPIVVPKTKTEIEVDKYLNGCENNTNYQVKEAIGKIVKQLEWCNFGSEAGLLNNNVAFLALKKLG